MKKTLHIMFLSHRGGLEQTFLRYLQQMKEENPDLLEKQYILGLNLNKYFKEKLVALGTTVYGFQKKNSYDFSFLKQAQAIIKEHSIQVVYGQNFPGNLAASLLGIRNKKLKVICHERGTSWNVNGVKSVMTKLWIKRADVIICNSNAAKILLKKRFNAPSHKLTVIYNGVPETKYHEEKKDPKNLLFVGRLTEVKSLDTALYAIDELKYRVPNVHLDVLGDGELYDEMNVLSKKLDIEENVTFHGNVVNVTEFMSKASILIFPSIREPFGNVTIEAAFQMTPTIGTNIDGIPEVIDHDKTGIVISPTEDINDKFNLKYVIDPINQKLTKPQKIDPILLAAEIEKLITGNELRTRMGELARRQMKKKFSMKKYYKKIVDVHWDS